MPFSLVIEDDLYQLIAQEARRTQTDERKIVNLIIQDYFHFQAGAFDVYLYPPERTSVIETIMFVREVSREEQWQLPNPELGNLQGFQGLKFAKDYVESIPAQGKFLVRITNEEVNKLRNLTRFTLGQIRYELKPSGKRDIFKPLDKENGDRRIRVRK